MTLLARLRRWAEDFLGIHEQQIVRWMDRGVVREKSFKYPEEAATWAAENLLGVQYLLCQPVKAIDLNIKVEANRRELR